MKTMYIVLVSSELEFLTFEATKLKSNLTMFNVVLLYILCGYIYTIRTNKRHLIMSIYFEETYKMDDCSPL